MTIGLSHGGATQYASLKRSQELLVGTKEGVAILNQDATGSWRMSHRGLSDLHISSLILPPQTDLIFAGAFHGSIHASRDGGRTWERRDTGLTQDDVYSLAWVERADGVRLYAGTEPAHLFYSDDFGSNWTELPGIRNVESTPTWSFPAPPHVAHTKNITFDPANPDHILVSVEQGGLLKSTDGGQTFSDLEGFHNDVHRILVHPEDSKRIFMTGGDGVYVSTDAGVTWDHRTDRSDDIGGYPDTLVLHPRQPDLMFIGAAHSNPGSWQTSHYAGAKISRSDDAGKTWNQVKDGLPDDLQGSIEAMCLEDYGDSFSIFFGTTSGEVFSSQDGGDHWDLIMEGLTPISKGGHYRALTTA
ncbi:uncharacterized protein METZ01_LOCUS95039 [marine metagenome]|uniref:Sortilin N-terminal domain-containing protein n=1 Tax=marine metagenome TaxID=408172 RepID=A0A381VPC7_9ZZZZ